MILLCYNNIFLYFSKLFLVLVLVSIHPTLNFIVTCNLYTNKYIQISFSFHHLMTKRKYKGYPNDTDFTL